MPPLQSEQQRAAVALSSCSHTRTATMTRITYERAADRSPSCTLMQDDTHSYRTHISHTHTLRTSILVNHSCEGLIWGLLYWLCWSGGSDLSTLSQYNISVFKLSCHTKKKGSLSPVRQAAMRIFKNYHDPLLILYLSLLSVLLYLALEEQPQPSPVLVKM